MRYGRSGLSRSDLFFCVPGRERSDSARRRGGIGTEVRGAGRLRSAGAVVRGDCATRCRVLGGRDTGMSECWVAGVTVCRSSSAGSRVLGYRDAGGRGDGAVVRGDYATRCRGLDVGAPVCRGAGRSGTGRVECRRAGVRNGGMPEWRGWGEVPEWRDAVPG